MKKFAVIDIGSNSVRLMFVADGKVLYKQVNTTRIGEGIATNPCLKSEAIERTAFAVAEYSKQAVAEGAEGVFAFATAAVRTAKNGMDFVKRTQELCGLEVDVISGEEEAELGVLGSLGNKDGGVIDVGGASTELVVKKGGRLIYKKSINIGVVRLKDKCGRDENALKMAAENASVEYGTVPPFDNMYAIGGTATTLAALKLGLTTYNSERVTGSKLTQEEIRSMAKKLLSMSVEEIAALPCMPKGRADVLAGGAVLLSELMDKRGISEFIVSDRDNLEGYAIKHGLLKE